MSLDFQKYHGLGNDFLVVRAADESAVTREMAMALCDRNFGVGADGVLIVSPASGTAWARMTVLNADGSRPEMCGNGLRCVALFLAHEAKMTEAEFDVLTDAGTRHCAVRVDAAAPGRGLVETTMGRGVLGEPFVHPEGSEHFEFQAVSMGNPHAVCLRSPISNAALDILGPHVSARWPEGSNVEIVSVRGPKEIDVHVWERGVGRTLACGTGAVGSTVVAAVRGLVPFEEPITVRLPGGSVLITVRRDLDTLLLGPAEHVFSGHLSQIPARRTA